MTCGDGESMHAARTWHGLEGVRAPITFCLSVCVRWLTDVEGGVLREDEEDDNQHIQLPRAPHLVRAVQLRSMRACMSQWGQTIPINPTPLSTHPFTIYPHTFPPHKGPS